MFCCCVPVPDVESGEAAKPVIDYARLRQLISIDGLSNRSV